MIRAEKHFLDLWPCKDTLHSFFLLGIFNAAGLHIAFVFQFIILHLIAPHTPLLGKTFYLEF